MTEQPASRSEQVRTFLLKVSARCNLNCSYCYEFNLADSSWRRKPTLMTGAVVESAVRRIEQHIALHDLKAVDIVFHGGEPLLAGRGFFRELMRQFRRSIRDTCSVNFGLQTNATLLDVEWLDFFLQHSIGVGVSVDGPKYANDRFRVDHRGRSSFEDIEQALSLYSRPKYERICGGLLAVMHPENDPTEVFDWLCSWKTPAVDFLFPLYNHCNPPPLAFEPEAGYGFGRWLSRIFDKWYGEDMHEVKIRIFEEIMHLLLGGVRTYESLGLSPVQLVVIQTDGGYEAVDSLKSTYEGAVATGKTVFESSIDEVLEIPLIRARYRRSEHLCTQCMRCELVRVCGGGYIPHRYHATLGFTAPSVYCRDLTFLIRHIEAALRTTGGAMISETIDQVLTPLNVCS